MKILHIIIVELNFIIPLILSFKCGFNSFPRPKITSISPIEENQNLRNLSSSYHPIKIYIDYEIIQNSLSEETLNSKKEAFNLAISTFQKWISISNNKRCTLQSYEINSAHSSFTASNVPYLLQNSKNIDADLFLIVSLDSIGNSQARAYPIINDKNNKRPILGVVELNIGIDTYTKNHIIYISNLLLHEISHILAFNIDLFPYFNKDLEKTIYNIEIDGRKRIYLRTPKVIEKAEKHFNAECIFGVELESQGDDGTAGSHWEARIMLGDLMIGYDYPEIVISDITLAVFEDSGWYKVNYYTGGLFKTGKNEGYNFLLGNCVNKDNGISNFELEFCNNQRDPFCSPGLIDRGYCYLGIYPEDQKIPKIYQNYNNPLKGGWEIANYCPVMQNDYEKSNNYYYYSRCNNIGKENYTDIGEKLSDTSFCFLSSLVDSSLNEEIKEKYSNEKAICYEVIKCDFNLKNYIINIGKKNFTFNNGNNIISYEVENFEGKITCPPFDRICSGNILCNDLYDCIEKKSETFYDNIESSIQFNSNFKIKFEEHDGFLQDYIDKCHQNNNNNNFSSSLFLNLKFYYLIVFIICFFIDFI